LEQPGLLAGELAVATRRLVGFATWLAQAFTTVALLPQEGPQMAAICNSHQLFGFAFGALAA
jgi:hypothetical protein